MEKNEESLASPKLQKVVQAMIAEEYFAYQLYFFSRFAVKAEDRGVLADMFAQIAADELEDHMKELVEWCAEYKVDVPATEAEFKRAAAKPIQKVVADLKKNKDAGYYIDQAIKQEELAIQSYKEALDEDEVCQFTDLQATLWHIFYDENDHLRNLTTAKTAYEAGADLVIS